MTQLQGLSSNDVLERRKRGEGNNVRIQTSRTYLQILRQNVLSFINIVLFIIGILLVALGLWSDALITVGVAMLSVMVSVVQEFRAKYLLDRISLLTRPKSTVIRDGAQQVIDPSEIVRGDIIVAQPGDQIVVDGVVVGEGRMEVDESLLTGESDLILKQAGERVLSGSFCATGSAAYEATEVGRESFANQLTASAKVFEVVRTPLQQEINLVIRFLVAMATVLGLLFAASLGFQELESAQIVQNAAVIAGLVPIGLIFMTAASYAMGAVRMLGRGALVQQSNAIESMSNVNVLCLDKTGTLTANNMHVHEIQPLNGATADYVTRILGDYAHSTLTANRTSAALVESCGGQSRRVVDEIPFSSARKYGALAFDDAGLRGIYAFGAVEMLQPYLNPGASVDTRRIDEWAAQGLRVLLAAYHPQPAALHDEDNHPVLPNTLEPLALVSFRDELRPNVKETLTSFQQAGIQLKIISGDNPHTVAALAKQAGFSSDIQVVSGIDLDTMDEAEFIRTAREATIFGRITPQQKEKLVDSLKQSGFYVAMIGDGVNDVLSLKKAQIGIAMQSGSAATRGVADIILLNDSFAALPHAFIEGQRILNGMKDIISLFLTRVFYAALLIVMTIIVADPRLFPIVPKHDGVLTLLTVGIPTFFLALWARPGPQKRGLVKSALRFVIPAAITIAGTALLIYLYFLYTWYLPAETTAEGLLALAAARTGLTITVVLCGITLILFAEPPTKAWVAGDEFSGDWRPTWLALAMAGLLATLLLIEPLRTFFEFERLETLEYGLILVSAALWAMLLRFIWRRNLLARLLGIPAQTER